MAALFYIILLSKQNTDERENIMTIQFKRINLCPDSKYPLYSYDAVDEFESEDVIKQCDDFNFVSCIVADARSLRICKEADGKTWMLRASNSYNPSEWFMLNKVQGNFKTKKEAIEYANQMFRNEQTN
ncbi:hypothetical protein NVP1081O_112 [Vibrio phage 1.081.O._10N.286.52.C2]|nr:hypothetical protein NVP1081O_112 [Vibrio phage 1.081.O._10N.286.52.C2]